LLKHPTLDLLAELGLHGMAKSFRDMADNPESTALGHAEWLGVLLEREGTLRQQKRFESRAKTAKLRHLVAVEDVDYRTPRGLDRAVFLKLAGCDWIREHRHCLLTGPAGVGKSWLACALGYKACRENLSVLYQRVPRLFAALALARGLGEFGATIVFAGSLQGVTQTLPLAIYYEFAVNLNVALAIAALLVIIATAILLSLKLGSMWQSSRLGSRYRYAITASS